MSGPTSVQVINGADGRPEFAVIPYADFISRYAKTRELIPNEVVGMVIEGGMTPMKAWREHLGLTQAEVAARLEISQAGYAQLEASERSRPSSLRRVAEAMGITFEQMDI